MYRAERMLVRRVLYGMRPAEAWRFVNPNSKSNDNSAAELTRREIQWYQRNRDGSLTPFRAIRRPSSHRHRETVQVHEAKRAVRPRR